MMGEPKKYGLIIPTKKSTNKPVKKLAVFGDDSSDDEDAAHKEVNLSLLQESQKKKQMKQTQIEIQKALEQDPSVYEYDAIYDQMEEKKKVANAKVPEQDRKPKYIENLLKSAASRKRDFERTIERQVQKEREQEDGEYEDKEAFVTEAFRKKMQEQAEEEERIKRQDAIDAANDVTKQKDLSLFYRNLLNQNVSLGGSFAADDKTNSKSIENEDLKNKPSELLGKADDKDNAKESENREQTEERNPSNRSVEKQRKEKDNKSPKAKEKSSRRNDEQERESRRHAKSPDRHRRHHEHSSRRRSYSDSDEDRKGHSKNSHRRDRKRQSRSDEGESRHRHSERRRTSHDNRKHSDRSEPKRTSHYDQKDNERKRDHHGERNREEKNVRVTDQQDPQTVGQETRESVDTLSEESKSKFAKRSTNETVMSAKERYLARKMAREAATTPADNDGSDED